MSGILEATRASYWDWNIRGNTVYFSPAFRKMFGYTDHEFQNCPEAWQQIIDPADLPEVMAALGKHLDSGGEAPFFTEVRFHHKDGAAMWVLLAGRVIEWTGDNAPARMVGCHMDITERKQTEAKREHQQRMTTLYNRMAYIFLKSPPQEIYTDVLEVILEVLESRAGYFGYIDDTGNLVCPSMTCDIRDQWRAGDNSNVFPRDTWGGLWGRSLLEKKALIANGGLQLPRGHVALESAMVVPILHQDKLIGQFGVADKPGGYRREDQYLLENVATQAAPVLITMQEKARQKLAHERLETQYRQVQKLDSIGRLSGGVAHDLNNLLSPILGYSEILEDAFDPQDQRREFVKEILNAGRRARDLVRRLLAFSRKQTLEFRSVDLNDLLKNFENLLRRTIREDVTIQVILDPSLPSIQGDVGQLEQVVMNLAVNAQDAMPGGGELIIETARSGSNDDHTAPHRDVPPGSYVALVFRDTGHGMDPETREHLFEPFFTTKAKGKGIGLGLATVYGIIKQHGGSIWVDSEPGLGATFTIYLPVAGGSPDPCEAVSKSTAAVGGFETILLVEDNRQVMDLVRVMLKRQGYTVLAASSGQEAITQLAGYSGTVHLLLTDVVMPEMNGKQLFEEISRLHPGVKALYMSGYADDVITHHTVTPTDGRFIQKPFTFKSLGVKVREVLDSV